MASSRSRLQHEAKMIALIWYTRSITMEWKYTPINSGKWSVRFKQYLKDENGVMRLGKPISILTGPYNQDGTKEIETIFGKKVFNNPKPKELIKYLLSFVFDGKDDKDGIYLMSTEQSKKPCGARHSGPFMV